MKEMATTKTTIAVKKTTAAKPYRKITATQFSKLTPATQRMKIAQDVLAQTSLPKKSRYNVERGYYCHVLSTDKAELKYNTELSKVLPAIQPDCHVCAMGALFLSHVRINNSFKLRDSVHNINSMRLSSTKIIDTMDAYFPEEQLRSIEDAFESCALDPCPWGRKFPDATKRLRAICHNIIRNKGDFDITQIR